MTDEGAAIAVTLRPMTAVEFEPWRELSIRNHAEQMARATGESAAVVEEQSRRLLSRVLAQGVQTEGMHFLVVASEAFGDVGSLWLGPHPEIAGAGYVYDIEVHEEFRARGLGRVGVLGDND